MKLKIILLTNSLNDFRNSKIIRLISFICRSNKDFKLLLTIAYDIVYSKVNNFHLLLVIIARICPTIFELPVNINDADPIKMVFMYLTKNEIKNLDIKYKMSKMSDEDNQFKWYLALFERLCNWKSNLSSSSEIYSHLMATINSDSLFETLIKFSSKATEYLLAFQLMCKYEGWQWTHEFLIKQLNEDILTKWALSKENKEEAIDDNLVSFFIYLKANLFALLCPREETEQITEVMKSFSIYLKESNLSIIQFKTVESLLLLAPRDPILAFTEIQHWLKPSNIENNKNLPESLKTKIKSVYTMLKPKLPSYVIINI
jgi:hypothetical protein